MLVDGKLDFHRAGYDLLGFFWLKRAALMGGHIFAESAHVTEKTIATDLSQIDVCVTSSKRTLLKGHPIMRYMPTISKKHQPRCKISHLLNPLHSFSPPTMARKSKRESVIPPKCMPLFFPSIIMNES